MNGKKIDKILALVTRLAIENTDLKCFKKYKFFDVGLKFFEVINLNDTD